MSYTVHASGDAVAIGTSEISLISGTTTLQNDTTAGTYQLVLSLVDAALTKSDLFFVTIKEKCLSGGTQQILDRFPIGMADSGILITPVFGLIHGWDMTLIGNVSRNWTWQIRKYASCTQYASQSALAVSSTELSMHSGTSTLQSKTDKGTYCVIVDGVGATMAKADVFDLKTKEKAIGASTQGLVHHLPIYGPQFKMMYTPWLGLGEGFDHTLIRTAGADNNFDVSVRKIG